MSGNTPAPSSPVPDADAYIVEAELVIRIDAMIRQRDATRAEAERLLRLLTAPGRDIR